MARKSENILLSFKFLATAAGLWFAWNSYQKKEAVAAAQLAAMDKGVTSTTSLAIPTGERLPYEASVTMSAPGDQALPTKPIDILKAQLMKKLVS